MDAASLTAWINQDFTFRATLVIGAMMMFASGPPLVLAWFLWRIGSRTVLERRYPPENVRMLREVPPITGSAAESRGRLLKVFATMVATGALLIALVLVRFAFLVWTR